MLSTLSWLCLALIHALPAAALFVPATLTTLYGGSADSPRFPLMQHRAALFLGVVIACVWAAFEAEPRRLAACLVALSMISFLVIFARAGMPAELRTIALVDLAGLVPLAFVAWRAFAAV